MQGWAGVKHRSHNSVVLHLGPGWLVQFYGSLD